jgi:hypothetical protein
MAKEGWMDESGMVTKGYDIGVNVFTDVEKSEKPMGKALHPSWRSQLFDDIDVSND